MTKAGNALITGANRGIGLAIAEHLADRGFGVVLTARDEQRLETACKDLAAVGATAAAFAADLRHPKMPAKILAAAEQAIGPIDVIVNNAGTAPSNKIEETDDETLAEVLDLHVAAPFRLIRAALPGMKQRGRGALIQIASTAGLKGFALITAYSAAKHAMVGLTRSLGAELARTPVRAYAVCPGFVETDITRAGAAKVAKLGKHSEEEVMAMYGAMNACGRLLRPDEVAAAVAMLANPACEVPNGSVYEMDAMPPVVRS